MTVQLNIDLSESLSPAEVDDFRAKCQATPAAPEWVLAKLIREYLTREETA